MPSNAQMRAYIRDKYPSKEWALKVKRMSKEQLLAVYFRLVEQSRKALIEYAPIRHAASTEYMCLDCFQHFVADNPELTECRFCGGEIIAE